MCWFVSSNARGGKRWAYRLLPLYLRSVVAKLLLQKVALGGGITEMAGEQEIVARLYTPCEAHEHAGVEHQGRRHSLRDALDRSVHVDEASDDESPIGHRSPKVDCLGADGRIHEREYFVRHCPGL